MQLSKLVELLKSNWKTIIVGVFMVFTSIKLLQIKENSESIHDVEWTLSSVESEVHKIRQKLQRR